MNATPLFELTPRDCRRPRRDGLSEFVPHGNRYGILRGIRWGDFERVNGFDMRYEGWREDEVDLAVRLRRVGLRCGWPVPGGTLLHLWHASQGVSPNCALVEETRSGDRAEAVEGRRQLRAEVRP